MEGVWCGSKAVASTIVVLYDEHCTVTTYHGHHLAVVQVLVVPPPHTRAGVSTGVEEGQYATIQHPLRCTKVRSGQNNTKIPYQV